MRAPNLPPPLLYLVLTCVSGGGGGAFLLLFCLRWSRWGGRRVPGKNPKKELAVKVKKKGERERGGRSTKQRRYIAITKSLDRLAAKKDCREEGQGCPPPPPPLRSSPPLLPPRCCLRVPWWTSPRGSSTSRSRRTKSGFYDPPPGAHSSTY